LPVSPTGGSHLQRSQGRGLGFFLAFHSSLQERVPPLNVAGRLFF
jgi:hypothetical protein